MDGMSQMIQDIFVKVFFVAGKVESIVYEENYELLRKLSELPEVGGPDHFYQILCQTDHL
jgi:hypothetical protein